MTPEDFAKHYQKLAEKGASPGALEYFAQQFGPKGAGNPNLQIDRHIQALAVKAVKIHSKSDRKLSRPALARMVTTKESERQRVKNFLDNHWNALVGMLDSS